MPALSRADQARVLTRRYLSCQLGDPLTLALLVLQAPFIGWLCTLAWASVESDTPSLWFVLCLSSVWFGCINACRELVRERAIWERERMFGLSALSTVASKLLVLGGLGLLQVVLLQGAVEWQLSLRGTYLLQTLALWLGSLAGAALGLAVSAFARRQEQAVAAVPLLLLPQILFSEVVIPPDHFTELVKVVEKLMPVRHAWTVFAQSADPEGDWLRILGALAALPLTIALLSALSVTGLLRRQEA
jgi:ABC transport system ATP-binding/permease protein